MKCAYHVCDFVQDVTDCIRWDGRSSYTIYMHRQRFEEDLKKTLRTEKDSRKQCSLDIHRCFIISKHERVTRVDDLRKEDMRYCTQAVLGFAVEFLHLSLQNDYVREIPGSGMRIVLDEPLHVTKSLQLGMQGPIVHITIVRHEELVETNFDIQYQKRLKHCNSAP